MTTRSSYSKGSDRPLRAHDRKIKDLRTRVFIQASWTKDQGPSVLFALFSLTVIGKQFAGYENAIALKQLLQ